MTFITRSTLHAFAVQSNPRLTYDQVPQEVVDMANTKVRSMLALAYITDDVSTHQDVAYLEQASICIGLEQLSYQGKIRWTAGEVIATEEGPFKMFYANRWLPNRWEATTQNQFESMFAHETWRMLAAKFVDAFISVYGKRAELSAPTLLHDEHMRGYGASERYRW